MKKITLAVIVALSGVALFSGCFNDDAVAPKATTFQRPASSPEAATDPMFDNKIADWKAQHFLTVPRKRPAVGVEGEGVCEDLTLKWLTPNVSVTEGDSVVVYATIDVADIYQEMGFQRIGLTYDDAGIGLSSAQVADGSGFNITNNYNGYGDCEYLGLVVGPTGNTFQFFDHPNQKTFKFTFVGLTGGTFYYVDFQPTNSTWAATCGQQLVMDTDGDDDGDCLICDDTDAYGGFALGTGSSGNRLKITVYGLE